MKVLLVCALLTVLAGWFFQITTQEWCIILMCIGAVLSLETINTAIEGLVDLVQPTQHPVAGKVKDLAAGAVLLASVISFICGALVFWKYISTFLN